MKWYALLAATVMGLWGAVWARAEILDLQDGTKLEGKVTKTPDGWSVTLADGKVVSVKTDQVVGIEAGTITNSQADDQEKLQSLRNVAGHMDNLNQIVDRYKKFIAQNPSSASLDDAKQDLDQWQQRQTAGMVKLGDDWVTTDERDRRQADAQDVALGSRDLTRQVKWPAATAQLQKALVEDPGCAAALYLMGIVQYKQGRIDPAMKSFLAADVAHGGYAPTLNNVAVTCWQEKLYVPAMGYYQQAMELSPENKDLLDNVAEALNGLPDAARNSDAAVKAAAEFAQQDAVLQRTQNAAGWFRWGSSWVTEKQLADFKAEQAKNDAALDDLKKQYNDTVQQAAAIDAQIDQNTQSMTAMQGSSVLQDAKGHTYFVPLPDIYYKLQAQNTSLAAQKKTLVQQESDLRDKAAKLKAQGTANGFTGVQLLMGMEAAPVRVATATTQPAS